ncbi:MAG: T9SS type A sorting domain-containing protein [Bacteroidota bacterium]
MNIPSTANCVDVAVTGNLACFLVGPEIYGSLDSLIIFEYSDNGSLERLSSIETGLSQFSLAASDTIVVVSADTSVEIFSIADPYHPRQVGIWTSASGIHSVSLLGNYLGIASSTIYSGMTILDLAIPSSPKILCHLPMAAWGIFLQDSIAFAETVDLLIYDISNPSNPVQIGNLSGLSGSSPRFALSKNFLYQTAEVCLYVMDVSNLSIPFQDGPIFQGYDVMGVAARNDTFYVSAYNDGFYIGKNNLVTSVKDKKDMTLPAAFKLLNNYPNPFNPSTVITYELPTAANVKIEIYNLLGQNVAEMALGKQEPGNHKVEFDSKNLSTGVYFCTLLATPEGGAGQPYSKTKKLLVIK